MVTLQSTSRCCKADPLYVGTALSTKTSVSCLVPAEVSLAMECAWLNVFAASSSTGVCSPVQFGVIGGEYLARGNE